MIAFEQYLRLFRFYEALSLYELYYLKLDYSLKRRRPPALEDDRPLTWVPLVFHCTSLNCLSGILKDGHIQPAKGKQYVSFTELPIAELSRLRSLGDRVSEVAIGFPRLALETRGLFQPAYLKHSAITVKTEFQNLPKGYIELNDDLGALNEVRVPGNIPLDDAVWVLCSRRNERTRNFEDPVIQQCMNQGIALSYWHPSHQQEMVQEPTFRKEVRDNKGLLISCECRGQYYMPKLVTKQLAAVSGRRMRKLNRNVVLPAGKSFALNFPSTDHLAKNRLNGWAGPYAKIDMAEFFINEIRNQFPAEAVNLKTRIQFLPISPNCQAA